MAAPGAVRTDLAAALDAMADQPGVGTLVENAKDPTTRRLYLSRIRYFIYYRTHGQHLDVVAFWHANREHGPSL
ncbi:MAG: type II toxin-antitoxin system RelE/ParE family toxin [Planctomycetia bacterium]